MTRISASEAVFQDGEDEGAPALLGKLIISSSNISSRSSKPQDDANAFEVQGFATAMGTVAIETGASGTTAAEETKSSPTASDCFCLERRSKSSKGEF